MSASACSSITAADLEITDNEDYGLYIDGSQAEIDNVEVSGNLRGIYTTTQSAPAEVRIAGASVTGNQGVGVGISGASVMTLEDSIVSDTRMIAPRLFGSSSRIPVA